jgi:hypothetical protein
MSWESLLSIIKQDRLERERQKDEPPVCCPNDATQLQQGPDGLFCPWDGWKYEK